MKKIILLIVTIFSFVVLAQTSEQYTYRTEFFFGNIVEGKTYNDVHKQQMEYLKFLKANDLKYGRTLFQPIWAGEYEYDIIASGYWPDGQEQYKEWGAYMNKYPAWAAENSEYDSEAFEIERSISMRGVRARGIRIPGEEYERFKFVDFQQCNFTSEGNLQNLLAWAAEVEAMEIEMGNRAGYGEHYLLPYRGADENVTYDFVIMRHYYSAEARSNIVASWPQYRDMMIEKGYRDEFRKNASCGAMSTFQGDWLYNSGN
tara:strand:+ start:368 stop:1144 length:777 start_codon:yes stop_codon:yes gene_type:complete